MFDFKIWKVILKKISLGSKFLMVKYSDNWNVPSIQFDNEIMVKTVLGGICTSDLHQIDLKVSLYESILASPHKIFPLGHEVVGEIVEMGSKINNFKKGDKVVYTPIASCESYGIDLCPSCLKGDHQACYCLTGIGDIESNYIDEKGRKIFGGFGGGGFSEYFKGFENQFFKTPEGISNECAVLTEPMAVAVHTVLSCPPKTRDKVIVIGSGIIGLMVISALKYFFPQITVISFAKYEFQKDLALKFGADQIISDRNDKLRLEKICSITDAVHFKPTLSKEIIYGENGPDIIYDCIASENSLAESMNLVRHKGTIAIVGLAFSITKKIDWSIVVHKEIEVKGVFIHGLETFHDQTKHAFEWALEILSTKPKLYEILVTHKFKINDFKTAIKIAKNKSKSKAIKVVFDYTK